MGVELVGESRGLVPSRDKFSKIRRATVSFGQGIAVTPLQLASAMASVVNGGKMMKPYLVKQVTDPEGRVVYRGEPKELRRTISPRTSKQVREILGTVVQEDGTATQARIEGFLVGGKTGTAQKVELGTGRYSPDKRIASFIGFLPLQDPEFLILVVVDEPKGEVYGGVVAAPAFNQIAVKTAYYMGLTPTEPVERAVARADRGEIGAGGIRMTRVATGPAEAESALVMPDVRGLSMGKVVDLMGRHSVRLELVGTGLARTQSPGPGGILVPGTACTVTFGAK
jgi:cell division protein FtsI (penicillin-binding protein 3)